MCKSTSLFPLANDFSADSQEDSESSFEDDEVDNLHLSQKIPHARSCHDEDFGLRVNQKRGEFAQRYLFKSGFRNSLSNPDRDVQEQAFSEKQYTFCSDDQSVADCTMNLSAQGAAMNSNPVVGVKQLEYIPESFDEEESHEAENQNAISGNDMFFSCCDWEALRNAEKQECDDSQLCHNENFSDSDDDILDNITLGQQSPKECRRKTKASRKFQNVNFAD